MSDVPDYPPEVWTERSSYASIPVDKPGEPVALWADRLLEPYGYSWAQVTEWRWVPEEVPFAQFVCLRPDGGRDWLTINHAEAPPGLSHGPTDTPTAEKLL